MIKPPFLPNPAFHSPITKPWQRLPANVMKYQRYLAACLDKHWGQSDDQAIDPPSAPPSAPPSPPLRPPSAANTGMTLIDAGMTLIEGLIAILIVSAVTVAITPPIFLSVATRVQNRRAEQAVQLASGRIDQVRVLIEQGITADNIDQLPADAGTGSAKDVPPPTSSFGSLQSTNYKCSEYDKNVSQVPVESALPVDINGDCQEDFYVQAFRINEKTTEVSGGEEGGGTSTNIPRMFQMGVRVYYRNLNFSGNVKTTQAGLTLSTGEGQQTEYPLAVMYTNLSQSDLETSLCTYHEFLKGSCQ